MRSLDSTEEELDAEVLFEDACDALLEHPNDPEVFAAFKEARKMRYHEARKNLLTVPELLGVFTPTSAIMLTLVGTRPCPRKIIAYGAASRAIEPRIAANDPIMAPRIANHQERSDSWAGRVRRVMWKAMVLFSLKKTLW